MIARAIEIRQYAGMPKAPGSELDSITEILVLESEEVDDRELLGVARNAVLQNGVPAYIIEDNRTYTEIGAGGAGQQLVLHIVSIASDPAIAGASAAIVNQLIEWGRNRRKHNRQAMENAGGQEASPELTLDHLTMRVKETVCDKFGANMDNLSVDEATKTTYGAIVLLSDEPRKCHYNVEVSDTGNLVHIEESRSE